ncbi:MAG TPA: tetratricopeptide repeat protein [Chryseolinea sp.]
MSSLLPGYEYDIFISYRHNDNLSGWVTEFVNALQEELAATVKKPLSIYFDKDPRDGLLETHNVDKSLEGKLKCLIFIPIISQTYCDTNSFAWKHEFCMFNKISQVDTYGRDIKLSNGNVASRILPIRIHDIDPEDKALLENELGGVLRAVEFIFRSPGVNRPLNTHEEHPQDNLNKTYYRDQTNKVANAVKELIHALHKTSHGHLQPSMVSPDLIHDSSTRRKVGWTAFTLLGVLLLGFVYFNWFYRGSLAPTEKSIAVIPFKLIGSDQEGKYFAEGVADALINHLHGIQDLKVRSRTSVEKYAGSEKTILEIGEELDVQYILEGSAQKYKDDIRIIVQLINTKTDEHIWFKEYNEKFDDIFKVQSEIALNITSELNIKLADSQKQKVQKVPTQNTESWDLYLRGKEYQRDYWRYFKPADSKAAMNFYKHAIEKDPEFALAYVGFASAGGGFISHDSIVLLLKTAIKLDPDLPDAYEHLGLHYLYNTREYDKAIEHIQKAIDRDSRQNFLLSLGRAYAGKRNHVKALSSYNLAFKNERSEFYPMLLLETGVSYLNIGDFVLAERFVEGALSYEPDNLGFLITMVQIQLHGGNYEGMFQTLNRSLSVRKENDELFLFLGTYYLLKKDFAKSEKTYRQFFSREHRISFLTINEKMSFAHVLKKLGKDQEAASVVRQVRTVLEEARTQVGYELQYIQAKTFAFHGDNAKAVAILREWEPRRGEQFWMIYDPLFESLRDDAEFKKLAEKLRSDLGTLSKEAETRRLKGEFPTLGMIQRN